MIAKFFDRCLNFTDNFFCLKWQENVMSHVTIFFTWEFQILYKEGGDNFHKIFSQSKCHQNLNNNQKNFQSFPHTVNSPVPAVLRASLGTACS